MSKPKTFTWFDYIKKASSFNVGNWRPDTDKINDHLHFTNNPSGLLGGHVPFVYILDYSSSSYLSMPEGVNKVTSYSCNDFIDGGLSLFLDKCHKDDLKIYNEQIFPSRIKQLAAIPSEEQSDYIFSYNFRFKNKKGEYINIIQKNILLTSDNKGHTLLSIGTLINVNHFTSENQVIQLVEKINRKEKPAIPELIEKTIFYIDAEERLFTKREIEILKWSADGFSSKQIAGRLFLSEHTVINHRKNMLNKSNCHNIAELVKYAVKLMII